MCWWRHRVYNVTSLCCSSQMIQIRLPRDVTERPSATSATLSCCRGTARRFFSVKTLSGSILCCNGQLVTCIPRHGRIYHWAMPAPAPLGRQPKMQQIKNLTHRHRARSQGGKKEEAKTTFDLSIRQWMSVVHFTQTLLPPLLQVSRRLQSRVCS